MPTDSHPPIAALRVMVVDDHTLFRRGLVALIEAEGRFAVVGEAADANEALRVAAACRPQVILLDHHLPGVAGADAVPALRAAAPAAQVLMLTMSEDSADLATALRNGAVGYLLKTAEGDELATAIERAARGAASFSATMADRLAEAFRTAGAAASPVVAAPAPAADPLAVLSPREREILDGIAQGESNKAIARRLEIAETTVKIHVQHILRKLDVSSRVQAAVLATQQADAAR
jgi:two-component system nitrate/nitrite response regulator NarL